MAFRHLRIRLAGTRAFPGGKNGRKSHAVSFPAAPAGLTEWEGLSKGERPTFASAKAGDAEAICLLFQGCASVGWPDFLLRATCDNTRAELALIEVLGKPLRKQVTPA